MQIITNGQTIDVPNAVEAEGGAAIDAFVQAALQHQAPRPPAAKRKAAPVANRDSIANPEE